MCMKSEDCKLQERVDAIDKRVTRLETRMADGFQTVTAAVNQLAADFGNRMNTLDQRIVEEKSKWGECFRNWLDWIVKLLILGCGAAMTNAKTLFGKAAEDLGDGSLPDENIIYTLVKPMIHPRRFSIMYIEFALAKIGYDISEFWTWLDSIEIQPGITAKRAWDRANDLSEDFEGFDQYFALAKKKLGLTDAQAELILESCIAKV